MTLSAYQDLFVSARDHDPRKTVGKEIMAMKQEYTAKYDEFASAVSRLEKEKQDLIRTFENNDQISKEERESSNKRHHEEFQFLKRINNTLKVKKTHVKEKYNPKDNPCSIIFTATN